MLYVAVATCAFVIGFAVARIGVWFRFARIEGHLHNLRMGLWDESAMNGGLKTVPVDWIDSEVSYIIKEEFG